jgi:acyl-coenzyme A thioesterase PaaI-like protein
MKKIKNPYTDTEGYNCFGCAPGNPIGLQLEFSETTEGVESSWQPGKNHEGYLNILHGGIQAALLDEVAAWVVTAKLKTAGFTTQMNIRLLKTTPTDKGSLKLKARLTEMKKNLAFIRAELFGPDGTLCTEGDFVYYTYSREAAKRKGLMIPYE